MIEAEQTTLAPRVSLKWIAALRILLGLMFLTTWSVNLLDRVYTPDGLVNFFNTVYPQAKNPLPLYAAFIQQVILPIRAFFAPFQLVTEGLLGFALLIGLWTPFFSLAGIFFLINTYIATLGFDWPWTYLMPIVILIVTAFTRAGNVWGMDGYLQKRKR